MKCLEIDTINFSKIDSIVFYDSLTWMNEREIEKYYRYDSLISKLKENYLYPFYFGLSKKKMNLYPVLIVIHSGWVMRYLITLKMPPASRLP